MISLQIVFLLILINDEEYFLLLNSQPINKIALQTKTKNQKIRTTQLKLSTHIQNH